MPRSKGRFSRLNKELRASGASATAGRAGEYLKFLKGENKIDVGRRPAQEQLQIFNVAVIPFGVSPRTGTADQGQLQVSMTVQADNIRNLFGADGNDARFGIDRNLANAGTDKGFYPALVRVFVALANEQPTNATSGILGATYGKYKRYKGRSGSIPFGRTLRDMIDPATGTGPAALGAVNEEMVKNAISRNLKNKEFQGYKVRSVSFVSEVWKAEGKMDATRPANAPTTIAAG